CKDPTVEAASVDETRVAVPISAAVPTRPAPKAPMVVQRSLQQAAVTAATEPSQVRPDVDDPQKAACPDPVLHYQDGEQLGWLCPDEAPALGLTIIDLSEKWAPRPFSPTDAKPPRFRDTYIALSQQHDPEGDVLPPEERLVEMYGVFPAPSVILRRLREV